MKLKNKILLITGGTGSFGNALINKYLDSDLKEIRILSRDEKKQDDMRKKYNHPKLKFYLGDVRDRHSISAAMHNVDFVFHAAALKQVPSCEFFPMEAVKTNVLGTENVMLEAIQNEVSHFILLSTDKAAYPINSMGVSKMMAEKLVYAKARELGDKSKTILNVTRYGNVMASRGSVIPLFFEQIKNGHDLTITDPNMTRFLMSLDEAVELVIYAFLNGKQGELFVQKSPASTVGDLAKAIIKMTKTDTKIKNIGIRHGEKIYETLLTKEESAKAISCKNYFVVPVDERDLNYDEFFEKGDSEATMFEEYNSSNTKLLTVDEIIEKINNLTYLEY